MNYDKKVYTLLLMRCTDKIQDTFKFSKMNSRLPCSGVCHFVGLFTLFFTIMCFEILVLEFFVIDSASGIWKGVGWGKSESFLQYILKTWIASPPPLLRTNWSRLVYVYIYDWFFFVSFSVYCGKRCQHNLQRV